MNFLVFSCNYSLFSKLTLFQETKENWKWKSRFGCIEKNVSQIWANLYFDLYTKHSRENKDMRCHNHNFSFRAVMPPMSCMASVLYGCSEPDINIYNSWYRDDKIPNIKSPLCTRGELNGPSAVWISQKMYSFISLEMGNVVITVNWSFWMIELWMKIQSFF